MKIKRYLLLGRKAVTNLDSILKSKRYQFADKGPYSRSCGFSSSHLQIWELNHKEGWKPNTWCFLIVVLEKTLERSLDCKEIKPISLKGNQPWIFIGRTDAEVEVLTLWPPDVKSWFIGKDSEAGKDWRQKEKIERLRWLDEIINSMEVNLSKLPEIVRDREAWHAAVQGSQRAGRNFGMEQQQQQQ